MARRPARQLAAAAAWPLGAATTSVLLALAALQPWRAPGTGPAASVTGDITFHAMVVRNLAGDGGWARQARLGAPFGQDLLDFPLGADRLHLLGLRLVSLVVADPYDVLTVYVVATFAAIALATYACGRWVLGLSRPAAAAASVAVAVLPYHFARIESGHVFLAAYVSVPVGVALVLWALGGTPARARPAWADRALFAGAVVVVGSGSPYYAAFTALGLLGAAAVVAVAGRPRRLLLRSGAALGGIVVVLALNLSASLLDVARDGQNPELTRPAAESDEFATRATQLLLPSPQHQLAPLAELGRRAWDVRVPGESGTALGTPAALGLVALAVLAVRRAAGRRDRWAATRPGEVAPWSVAAAAGLFTAMAVVGGTGSLVALLGVTQIRAWGRASVLVAVVSWFALALFAQRWLEGAGPRRGVVAATCGLGLLAAVGDGVGTARVGDRDEASDRVAADAALARGLERRLPTGASVAQLPLVDFPEAPPPGRLRDYDLLRPFLYTDDLRWGFGGTKGGEADWQRWWAVQPLPVQVRALAAAGFDALWLDLDGTADPDAARAEVVGVAGQPAGRSADGRVLWFRLDDVDHPAVPATAVTRPLVVAAADGLSPTDWTRRRTVTAPVARHRVESLDGRGGDVRVQLVLRADRPRRVEVGPPGRRVAVCVDGTPRPVELVVPAPDGTAAVELLGGAPGADGSEVEVVRASAADERAARALAGPVPPVGAAPRRC